MPSLVPQLHRRFGRPDSLSRREMIQRSLAAAAGLLLSDRLAAQPAAAIGHVVSSGRVSAASRPAALQSGAAAARRIAASDGADATEAA